MKSLISTLDGKLVDFYAEDGLRNSGFLMSSKTDKRCIIHVHGMTGNFYRGQLFPELRKQAKKKGYALFTINTRGHDVVSGFNRMTKDGEVGRIRYGTSLEKFEDSLHDLSGAIKAMKKLGYKKFVLSGHSTGCQKITHYQYAKKDKDVKGLILLAPADDYNLNKAELAESWAASVKNAKKLHSSKRGHTPLHQPYGFSAQRFLSIADSKRIESRLFDYKGRLREFSSVKTPIFAAFGSEEQHALVPVREYLDILERKTKSINFKRVEISGADHGFHGHEQELMKQVTEWLATLA